MDDFWLFGYGSLMWNPGFEPVQTTLATMYGTHRALCIYSWVHRGTEERPGLVLGLDRGGSCRGMAMRVDGRLREQVIDYLRARELVTKVYYETWRRLRLDSGVTVEALTYVVDRQHQQYAGRMAIDEMVRFVRQGKGRSGINRDYVLSTRRHLAELGIHDPHLEEIAAMLA